MSTNVIPLAQAVSETDSWRALADVKLAPNDIVYSFTVPLVNFEQIIESGAVAVRAYLGQNEDEEKTLLVVGVDKHNKDMIDYNAGQYVYNFSTPCPNSCPPPSPLNS